MNEELSLNSKVLTFDTDISVLPKLKKIFEKNNLTGLRSIGDLEIIDVILSKNIHLGALFVNNQGDYIELSEKLKFLRPELPLFLRLENKEDEAEIPAEKLHLFDGFFHISEAEKLSELLTSHIFYPQISCRNDKADSGILCQKHKVSGTGYGNTHSRSDSYQR